LGAGARLCVTAQNTYTKSAAVHFMQGNCVELYLGLARAARSRVMGVGGECEVLGETGNFARSAGRWRR